MCVVDLSGSRFSHYTKITIESDVRVNTLYMHHNGSNLINTIDNEYAVIYGNMWWYYDLMKIYGKKVRWVNFMEFIVRF